MTSTATTEPTIAEQLLALQVAAHRLATERDQALGERADLLEANCYLQQEADRARRWVHTAAAVEKALRKELDTRNWEVRQLTRQRNRLAERVSELEAQADRKQQQAVPRRRFLARLRRRR